ncbi:UPF0175 family protein [Candidatus Woesearchaeota archaeon]|nr:UPF0175 family protein [Candidatus Woesearchaeota archaeon]
METISVRMDTEDLTFFSRVLKEKKSTVLRELVQEGKKYKAIELFRQKKVSLGLGARLAGVTLSEFIDLLREQNVTLNIEENDVEEALKTVRKTW